MTSDAFFDPRSLPLHEARQLENRLIVLQALSFIGPADSQRLFAFCDGAGVLGYFDCMDAVDRLIKEKLVIMSDSELLLSPDAENTLHIYHSRLPVLAHDAMAGYQAAFLNEEKQQRDFPATLVKTASGFTVHLAMQDDGGDRVSLMLPVPTRELAERMKEAWPEKAGLLYQTLMKQLLDDSEDEGNG